MNPWSCRSQCRRNDAHRRGDDLMENIDPAERQRLNGFVSELDAWGADYIDGLET